MRAVAAGTGISLAVVGGLLVSSASGDRGGRADSAPVAPTEGAASDVATRATGAPASPVPMAPRVTLPRSPAAQETPPYDGGYHFLRVQFGAGRSGLRGFGRRGREAPWEHDRPRAERNFLRILSTFTYVNKGEGRDDWLHLPLDDPDLFRYPIAYIVEVGYWDPTETEARALREYLLKGGFLIVDDFRGGHIYNFRDQMRRVLPGAQLFQITGEHDIFDSFFRIEHPERMITAYGNEAPVYLGIFEDNDPSGRLLAIVNYNNDIAEYWEYSGYGYYAVDLANVAYQFGVNYVVYGMTH